MIIAETASYTLGPYTVQQRPRFDNPAFAVYLIFRGDRLIGKHFSMPDLSCCEWLERQIERPVYAEGSAQPRKGRARGVAVTRRGGAKGHGIEQPELDEAPA